MVWVFASSHLLILFSTVHHVQNNTSQNGELWAYCSIYLVLWLLWWLWSNFSDKKVSHLFVDAYDVERFSKWPIFFLLKVHFLKNNAIKSLSYKIRNFLAYSEFFVVLITVLLYHRYYLCLFKSVFWHMWEANFFSCLIYLSDSMILGFQ